MRQTTPSEALLRSRVSALGRRLAAVRAGDPRAVHQARVATRRLRAALPLMTTGTKRRKLERMARRLTRALGPLRELDVTLDMLADLHERGDLSTAALTPLRASIAEERRVALAHTIRRVDRVDIGKLRRRMRVAARQPDESAAERRQVLAMYAENARRRAARRADALRVAVERAGGMYLPHRLHDIRIAVKKLRYALEVARHPGGGRASGQCASGRGSLAAQISTLTRAQDLLGRVHDLEVLIARIRAVQSAPHAPDLKISGALDALVRRLETECRQLHARYVGMRQAVMDVCDRAMAAAARTPKRAA